MPSTQAKEYKFTPVEACRFFKLDQRVDHDVAIRTFRQSGQLESQLPFPLVTLLDLAKTSPIEIVSGWVVTSHLLVSEFRDSDVRMALSIANQNSLVAVRIRLIADELEVKKIHSNRRYFEARAQAYQDFQEDLLAEKVGEILPTWWYKRTSQLMEDEGPLKAFEMFSWASGQFGNGELFRDESQDQRFRSLLTYYNAHVPQRERYLLKELAAV